MSRIILATALAFAATLPSVQAQAQYGLLTHSFVSSSGVDTNPCTIAAPCATFVYAYAAIGSNGIIAALDPGKYGPLTIIGPVTINGNGWAAVTGAAEANAITVNANTTNGDVVILKGLEIDGAGAAYNGIVFNSGGSLTVTDCTVQKFVGTNTTGNGILIQPTSGTMSFVISNTTVSNNGFMGIFYLPPSGSPSINGVIDHVVATGNSNGIVVQPFNTSGGSTTVAISNSIASNNTNDGIDVVFGGGGSLTVSIDNAGVTGNGAVGVDTPSSTAATVRLGRSVITGNFIGVVNSTSPNGFFTYNDNRINGNTSNQVAGALLTETLQ
jgi:hypothetical protein